MKKIYSVANEFRKKAETFDNYVKRQLVEMYEELGAAPPDDVRVKAAGQNPIQVTVWSNSYAPEYKITFEGRLTQQFDPNREGTYNFEVRFFDSES